MPPQSPSFDLLPPSRLRRVAVSSPWFVTLVSLLLSTTELGAAPFSLEEATIEQLERAMDAGSLSSVELTTLYLNRIHAYDRHGPKLNAIPVLNPAALSEAAAADQSRAEGKRLGPLHGIPYTVKDSYKVKGLTVASGSPAFAQLVANEDAFTVARIRQSGGVLLGKTNMPPLAAGGMQPGVYGRSESPYNPAFLASARGSGSSNGSGVATSANLAVFGMGEETVSSGRAPSSNNGLVAYTPSRGVISIRGNWPLFPDKDVVVPMTRTMGDMLALLDVIMVDDPVTRGDFWRDQKVVKLPAASSIRPKSFAAVAQSKGVFKGKRIGVPTCFIGKEDTGGFTYKLRPSIEALWERTVGELKALGAEVIELELPAIHNYHEDTPNFESVVSRGIIPKAWWRPGSTGGRLPATPVASLDFTYVHPYFYEEFLKDCRDPNFPSWSVVDAALVFPYAPGSIDAKLNANRPNRWAAVKKTIVEDLKDPTTLPDYAAWLQGLEKLRRVDFEDWMAKNRLDLVAFPSAADFGPADCETNEASYEIANRNGVARSSGNSMLRHVGIPTVSVTMGQTEDVGMPVNVTFAGPAYSDSALLAYGSAYEAGTRHRRPPGRITALADETLDDAAPGATPPAKRKEKAPPELTLARAAERSAETVVFRGSATDASGVATLRVYVNGHKLAAQVNDDGKWAATAPWAELASWKDESESAVTVIVFAKDKLGNAAAQQASLTLP